MERDTTPDLSDISDDARRLYWRCIVNSDPIVGSETPMSIGDIERLEREGIKMDRFQCAYISGLNGNSDGEDTDSDEEDTDSDEEDIDSDEEDTNSNEEDTNSNEEDTNSNEEDTDSDEEDTNSNEEDTNSNEEYADANLDRLSRAVNLENMIIAFSKNLTVGSESKRGLTKLKDLVIDATKIHDVGCLENLKSLKTLGMSGNFLEGKNIRGISRLTNLKELWIVENRVKSIGYLGALTRLRSLEIDGEVKMCVQPPGINMLTNLTSLKITGNKFDFDAGTLRGLTNLTSLKITGNKFYFDLGILRGLTNLQHMLIAKGRDNVIVKIEPETRPNKKSRH